MLCIVKPYWHQACSTLSYERTRNGCFNVAGLRCGLCPTRSDDLEQSLSVVCPDYRLGPGNRGSAVEWREDKQGVEALLCPGGATGFKPRVSTREPSNQDESPCMGVSSREGSSVGSPWTSFPSLLTWIAGGRNTDSARKAGHTMKTRIMYIDEPVLCRVGGCLLVQ